MAQADTVQKLVGEFGGAAKAKLGEGGQPEDQLRNPLEQLFAGLSGECGHAQGAVILVGEKSLAELRTRPDFAVQLNKELIGFIEVKARGKGADSERWRSLHVTVEAESRGPCSAFDRSLRLTIDHKG